MRTYILKTSLELGCHYRHYECEAHLSTESKRDTFEDYVALNKRIKGIALQLKKHCAFVPGLLHCRQ